MKLQKNYTRQDRSEYLSLLFEEGEWICAASNVRQTASKEYQKWADFGQKALKYICINPLKPKHGRKGANLALYRNFMIEFDSIPIEDQFKLIESLKIPFSVLTFSGNKSLHAVISLTEPVSQATWYRWMTRMHQAIPHLDKACKSPAQLTRLPGDSQPVQRWGCKIDKTEMVKFIDGLPVPKSAPKKPEGNVRVKITKRASRWLAGQGDTAQGHADSVHTALCLIEVGMSEDKAIEIVATTRQLYVPSQGYDEHVRKARRVVEWAIEVLAHSANV